MRTRSMVFCLALLAASAAACGGGSGGANGLDSTPLRGDEQPRSSGAPREPTPLNTGAQAAPSPSAGAIAAPPPVASASPSTPPAAPSPKTAAECKALAAKVTPPPSNQTDTQLQMRAFFDGYHETFRCCFDALWSSQHPGASGTVSLLVSLDAVGSFSAAQIDASGTTVQSPEVQACIIDIAKSLTYPKPASGKGLAYTRVLNFSPRR